MNSLKVLTMAVLVSGLLICSASAQDRSERERFEQQREQVEQLRRGSRPEHFRQPQHRPFPPQHRMGGGEHGNFNNPHFRPPTNNFRRPPVGYRPVITWIPQGMSMGVGPVVVSPDRRYVRMGIGVGFYHIPQVYTFNYVTGQSGRQE